MPAKKPAAKKNRKPAPIAIKAEATKKKSRKKRSEEGGGEDGNASTTTNK